MPHDMDGYGETRKGSYEPPKAPDTVAAEKKKAARIPNSECLYQLHIDQIEREPS